MKPKFKLSGIRELEAALRRYDRDAGRAYARGLEGIATKILEDATELAPVDTGALRASGVHWIEGSGWNAVAWVGFGAEVEGYFDKHGRERIPANYAVYQHDEPYEVKYLEEAVEDNFDDLDLYFWQALVSP